MQNIMMKPIGYVKNHVQTKKDVSWGNEVSTIVLNDEYHSGLTGLDGFSHAIVVYYLDKAEYQKEKHLQRRPQNREDMPLVGIFSQRGKDRPNQIGITSVQILSVDDAALTVKGWMQSAIRLYWISSPTILCMTGRMPGYRNG